MSAPSQKGWGLHLPSFPLQQVLLGAFPGLDHIPLLEALEPVSEYVTFWLWNGGQRSQQGLGGRSQALHSAGVQRDLRTVPESMCASQSARPGAVPRCQARPGSRCAELEETHQD